MTKEEAIKLLEKGVKMTHPLFAKTDWITMENGKIKTEEGYECYPSTFWDVRSRAAWEINWEVYQKPLKLITIRTNHELLNQAGIAKKIGMESYIYRSKQHYKKFTEEEKAKIKEVLEDLFEFCFGELPERTPIHKCNHFYVEKVLTHQTIGVCQYCGHVKE